MLNDKYQQGSVEALKAGIIWREKLDYGKTLINFLSIWVAAQFVLQIFFHPGFILAYGSIYALLIGAKSGGNEVTDGAEEFSFSLAVPRSARYKCKYIYGLKPLLLILVLSLLTIYFNLSQIVWGLFVESGLNNPYSEKKAELFWYILAFLVPICLHTTIFSFSICTYGRSHLNRSLFAGILICGFAVIVIAIIYNYCDIIITNILTVLILVPVITSSIWISFKSYCYKEGMSISRQNEGARSRAGIITVILILIVLFFLMLFWASFGVVRSTSSDISPNSPVKIP